MAAATAGSWIGDGGEVGQQVRGFGVQELARVGRALLDLPRLERALVANELPWSKVRLLVRVLEAGQGDEETWIALARVLSTQRLERAVREHAGTALAHDPEVLKNYPPADMTVEKIGDLLGEMSAFA